ncbi:hypothetical protein PPYR_10057 [Photinus pyralis]|uniref:Secreted protein n=1 Tax=Photinus pyralis TaxID=7054 RepID=A0A5N4AFC2_PHOPY|nr:uncharacterized protein LOC116174476 [Photinus pyralis]KAB0795996.1 hypothetical protein PPYR_10057 [Photinus pyralis]
MQYFTLQFAAAVLVSGVFSKSAYRPREPRMFWRSYTETMVVTDVVTSILPSSCVHVEPTLPACRGLRNLETFPEFVGREIHSNQVKGRQLVQPPLVVDKDHHQLMLAPLNETRVVGWAEYLGLVGATFTVTEVHLKTTTVIDPRTVVTFSVKGCRPSRLPMELDRCPVNQYNVDEIVPSSVSPPSITPTALPGSLMAMNDERNSKNLEPSSSGIPMENLSQTLTEDLSDVTLRRRNS